MLFYDPRNAELSGPPPALVLAWADAVSTSLREVLDGALDPVLPDEHLVSAKWYDADINALDILASPSWLVWATERQYVDFEWLRKVTPFDLAEAVLAHTQLGATHLATLVRNTPTEVLPTLSFVESVVDHPSVTDEVLVLLVQLGWLHRERPRSSRALKLLGTNPVAYAANMVCGLPLDSSVNSMRFETLLEAATTLGAVDGAADAFHALARDEVGPYGLSSEQLEGFIRTAVAL